MLVMAMQKVHETLQAYDSRDSEVVEGLPVKLEETQIQKWPKDCANSEEDTSQDTPGHTTA